MAPALQYPPELLLKAQNIRWAIFDVDGVLTDGRIYVGEHGEQFKAFSTLDGHGLKMLGQFGIVPTVITGRDSPAVRRRVADLGIVHGLTHPSGGPGYGVAAQVYDGFWHDELPGFMLRQSRTTVKNVECGFTPHSTP